MSKKQTQAEKRAERAQARRTRRRDARKLRAKRRRRHRGGGFMSFLLKLIVVIIALPLVLLPLYNFIAPPISTLMLLRGLQGAETKQTWMSLDEISPNLIAAVLSAEDSRFCTHNGVDWPSIELVVDDLMEGENPRGASTITMQLVKNLILWPDRSYIRKGLELPLALYGDLVWSKRRTIELYLNVVEWAPGIYGAQAAAMHHFQINAKELTRRQAALLATALPNPIRRSAGNPSAGHQRLARRIERRMQQSAGLFGCVTD